MKRVILFAVTLVCACAREESAARVSSPAPKGDEPAVAVTSSGTVADTGAPQSPPEITITEPGQGAVISTNPVVVRGRARTFENNVIVRLRDEKNALIAERFTTSRGEMGSHNPYEIEIFVTRDPGSRLTIEALEYSAKDGSERSLTRSTHRFSVPLIDAVLHVHDPKRAPVDCGQTFPNRTRLPKSVSAARLLTEALVSTDQFPRGAAVRSVNLRNGVLTVDFNDRLQNVGGSCRAQAIRASIDATLRALPGVREVVITAGGSRDLALQP